MANGFRDRFASRVVQCRPTMSAEDHREIADGRIVAAPRALRSISSINWGTWMMRLPKLSGWQVRRGPRSSSSSEQGIPTRSIYSIGFPNVPLQSELIPFSYSRPGTEQAPDLPPISGNPIPRLTKLSFGGASFIRILGGLGILGGGPSGLVGSSVGFCGVGFLPGCLAGGWPRGAFGFPL